LWREAAARFGMPADSELAGAAAIVPGWIGYIGFEMARQLERLPASHREDLGLPLMRMALFDRGILLDHVERRARLIAWPSDDTAAEEMRSRWNDAGRRESPVAAPPRFAAPSMRAEVSQADYERSVRRALEYIAAGDIYQVNLSQRWTLDGLGDPLAVHAAIRASNPAPHAALLRFGDRAVVSASPELFLSMHNGRVLTRPIKGTRPRTGDAVLDEAYRRQLLASDKDAAELAMIVDLHRNDLGRVCEFGSIRVCRARLLEEHPTVFHTVAEIEGRLARGRDAFDLLGACFPAGSITGAPKIRAIEIIDELEPCARGAYTGAIGVVGLDGSMAMNVAIRTLQLRGGRGVLHAGGGIVADSDPTEEYEETLAKARGIMRALGPSACAAAEPSGSAGNEGGVSLCPESGGLRGGRTRPLA
jgi:para-aminobenzoate synthetase component 1